MKEIVISRSGFVAVGLNATWQKRNSLCFRARYLSFRGSMAASDKKGSRYDETLTDTAAAEQLSERRQARDIEGLRLMCNCFCIAQHYDNRRRRCRQQLQEALHVRT